MIQLPTAVSGVNNNRTEPSELIQERSIFEHVNGNLRPSVTLAQNHVNGNVVNGTGSVDTAVEARITTDPSRVTVGEENQETTGIFFILAIHFLPPISEEVHRLINCCYNFFPF